MLRKLSLQLRWIKKKSSSSKKSATRKRTQKPVLAKKTVKKDRKKPVKEKKAVKKQTSTKVKKLSKSQKLLKESERKWQALHNKHQNSSAPTYKISGVYQAKTSIMHRKFGWGYILSVKNDRLEVIFKEDVKFLVSNNLGVIR